MRKVVLLINLSLDGFVAGPNGEMDWISVDDEMFNDIIKYLQDPADTALFGRVNYKDFEGYWPSVLTNPSSSEAERSHAQWLENSTKIVFSRTLDKVEWKNTRIVRENIAEEIARLKQQPGKNMLLFGGASIASTFIQQGLIDEYWINLNPVALGEGKPLFRDLKEQMNLKLLETKVFKSGVVTLHYAAS